MPFTPETLQILEDRDYLRGTQMANVAKITRHLGRYYMDERIVQGDSDEEREKCARTIPEMRFEAFGASPTEESEEELNTLIRRITSADGPLQDWVTSRTVPLLDEEEDADEEIEPEQKRRLVLCSCRVMRPVTNGNGEIIKRQKELARFVSDNPEQVEQHFVLGNFESLKQVAYRTRARMNVAVAVVPALAARKQAWIDGTLAEVHAQLPPGSQS